MPESEIHVISAIEKMDARPEETAYGFRTQESDVKTRINTLFSEDSERRLGEGHEEEEEDAQKIREDYETVNEGMTTDTSEGPSAAVRRGELADTAEMSGKD